MRLAKDLDINYVIPEEHITALFIAARDSTPHFVKLCLDEGANPLFVAEDGSTAFMQVCMNLDPDATAMEVLRCHIDDLSVGRSDVSSATLLVKQRKGRSARARMLSMWNEWTFKMGMKSRLHAAHSRGCTALHIASKHGHDELVRWILDNGGVLCLHETNNMGLTPLEMSWMFGPHAHTESLLSSMILRNRSVEANFRKKYRVNVLLH